MHSQDVMYKPVSGKIEVQIFEHLNKLKNTFVLFFTQKKIAIHLMISGIFFI